MVVEKTTAELIQENEDRIQNMRYTPEELPGLLFDDDLAALRYIAGLVPNTGKMFEAGTGYGKSAVTFASEFEKLGKDIPIFTCDPIYPLYWKLYATGTSDSLKHRMESTWINERMPVILDHIKGYNITFILDRLSDEFKWNEPLSCFFEDSDHSVWTLATTLPWGLDKLVSGGVLCGHDYTGDFCAVKPVVDKFAEERGFTVHHYPGSSVWYIIKP